MSLSQSTPSEGPALFKRITTPEALNRLHEGTVVGLLGIEFTEVGTRTLRARMPVDQRTIQPAGILHGGASVTLAETMGSVAAFLCLEEGFAAVGLDINANHLRAMRHGWVYGFCRSVHVGRSTQVWQIEIEDEQARPVCTSRITMAVVPQKPVPSRD